MELLEVAHTLENKSLVLGMMETKMDLYFKIEQQEMEFQSL